jgi:selenoprotein W-related protein
LDEPESIFREFRRRTPSNLPGPDKSNPGSVDSSIGSKCKIENPCAKHVLVFLSVCNHASIGLGAKVNSRSRVRAHIRVAREKMVVSSFVFAGILVLASAYTLHGFGVGMIDMECFKATRSVLHSNVRIVTPIRLRTVSVKGNNAENCEDCSRSSNTPGSKPANGNVNGIISTKESSQSGNPLEVDRPRVTIEYCTGCRWLLRAGWTAQELLTTFEKEVSEVAIRPGRVTGVFNVWVDAELVWNRTEIRRFPEMKELKQKIRDVVNPERDLGHSDK